jgi:hypothetical protein
MIIRIERTHWITYNNNVFELPLFTSLNIPIERYKAISEYVLLPISINGQEYVNGPLIFDTLDIEKINKMWDFCMTNSIKYLEIQT